MVADSEHYSRHVKSGKRISASVEEGGIIKTRISVDLDIIFSVKNPRFCHQRAPADDNDDWEIDRSKDKPFDGCPYNGCSSFQPFCHLFFRLLKREKKDSHLHYRCDNCLEIAGFLGGDKPKNKEIGGDLTTMDEDFINALLED